MISADQSRLANTLPKPEPTIHTGQVMARYSAPYGRAPVIFSDTTSTEGMSGSVNLYRNSVTSELQIVSISKAGGPESADYQPYKYVEGGGHNSLTLSLIIDQTIAQQIVDFGMKRVYDEPNK